MKISDFRILSDWTEKYKPPLSKSDSCWNNFYSVSLVIVSLAVNIGKLQSLLSEEASLQRFLHKLKQKTFLMKLNMINCIFLVLLLLVSIVLLKCANSPPVIHFLNFVRLFCL